MKAHRILIGFLAAGLLATGCTKQYIKDEHIYYQGLGMTLIDFQVKAANWSIWEVPFGNEDEATSRPSWMSPKSPKMWWSKVS